MVTASLARVLDDLAREITWVSAEIARLVRTAPEWVRRHHILQSCPGIGATTVALLVAELPELGQCDDTQIAALVGVASMTQQSGRSDGTARIEGGRQQVRTGLWMPTLTAMKWNPVIAAMATRLRDDGKPHKVVVVACLRKLLVLLNAMVRNDETWAPRPTRT